MYPVHNKSSNFRINNFRLWYGLIVLFFIVVLVRLFYLQIIRHDFYRKSALNGQRKEYIIPASRGVIEAHDGDKIIPLVLNEKRYTLFADPIYLVNPSQTAKKIAELIGGDQLEYESKMNLDTRYSVLAKRLDKSQKEKIEALGIKGIGLREQEYRTYPQNELASQILGFVDEEGVGKYGLEEYMDEHLKGSPGELKAITDARGVPLPASEDNIVKRPLSGKKVILTIDVSMQRQLEDILKEGLDRAKSKSGSALIMDPMSGAIKAMANFPTYNPAEYSKVEDLSLFNNANVSEPMEIGSTMKPLIAAAALNKGVVTRETTYYDPSFYIIDEARVSNIEEDGGPGVRSVADILQMSLNTGATWLLMQLGGGELNEQGRVAWHDYMANRYRFGKLTGIEQGYEAPGVVPDPKDGYGLNIQYANTAFGQGLNITTLQLASALSSVINGGNYYRPHLVEKTIDNQGNVTIKEPEIIGNNVVSPQTGQVVKELMEYVMQKNHRVYKMANLPQQYSIGGKTGTAEVAKPEGGYYDDRFNGTFMGFVGGNQAEYVVVVRVNEPKIGGYAGSQAAAPIFSNLSLMLINNFGVTPKGQ